MRLDRQRKTYINKLSGGEKQKLSILLSLLGSPKIVFWDELTTLLFGHLRPQGLEPGMVFSGPARRTSRESLKSSGFTEPTCTVVWKSVCEAGLDPRMVILWNAFPWHPSAGR